MHNYYHTSGNTDQQAMADEAQHRLKRTGEPSIIHLHPYSEPCHLNCDHEQCCSASDLHIIVGETHG